MKLDVENLGATKRRLKVEIPHEEVDAALENAYKELNKGVKVPGFRPGHVPRGILEKRYGESVEAEVAEKLVPRFYFKAVEEAGVFPVDSPSFEDKSMKLKKGQSLTFTATVEVRPDFTLAPYRGIEITAEELAVTDEELAEALEEVRDVHSTLETVEEDRPTAKGDYLVIDFEGFVGDKAIEGGRAENYTLHLGSGTFIPGFEEQLEGKTRGAAEVKVRFPDDYKNKELAGKDAVFKVALKEIKKKVLPELDDELAKSLGLGQTLDEMKEKLKKDILGYKERGLKSRQKDMIMKELARMNQFELPASMVEKEFRALATRRYQDMVQTGGGSGFDMKAFEAEARPAAEERVKVTLILSEIADKEGISVSDAELEAGIRKLAAESGYNPQRIRELYEKRDGSLEGLRGIITEDKVLEFLLAEAKKA